MTELHIMRAEIITSQYQDLLLEANNLSNLRSVFKQIRESIKEDDIEPAHIPYFIEGIKTTIENHCYNIAHNFFEVTAQAIEEECTKTLQWLDNLVVDSSKEEID